jgi:hypothetical protein
MALATGGFMFAGAPRSDAQVYFSIGFGFPGLLWIRYYQTVTTIRTGIIIDRTIAGITIAPITGHADVGIIGIIISTTITGTHFGR